VRVRIGRLVLDPEALPPGRWRELGATERAAVFG
jgi:16S rRNA U516 pseudouridylate synthase RsuA-like enzyme